MLRVLKWLVALAFTVAVAVGAAVVLATYDELTATLPPIDRLLDYDPPVATRVYADDGTLIEEFYRERRYRVPIEHIPPLVRNAFLAAEDSDFFAHRGVDFVGILRAALANFQAGSVVQGASTITQQVVKALLLTPERSYERKLKEILLALRLEQQLTKEEILELYLNQIYLGDGNHGVGAAALNYFGKSVQQLTAAEAAMLAGLPAAPSRYSPNRAPEAARTRQLYVLRRMLEERYLSAGDYQAAVREKVQVHARRQSDPTRTVVRNYYTEAVRLQLEDMFGAEAPYNQGYSVYTAMQPRLQKLAQSAVRNGIERIDKALGYRGPLRRLDAEEQRRRFVDESGKGLGDAPPDPERLYEGLVTGVAPGKIDVVVGPWKRSVDVSGLRWHSSVKTRGFSAGDVVEVRVREPGRSGIDAAEVETTDESGRVAPARLFLGQTPKIEAALVAIDMTGGGIAAMVGGYDFMATQFNRAIQAKRQPGSAFKPFVYAAALDHGFTAASILQDTPVEYMDNGKPWVPRNYSRDFKGAIRLRTALEQSRNVVSVKLVDKVGIRTVVDYLGRFRFDTKFDPNLSLALGTAELTLRDLTEAYTAFANGGVKVEPVVIRRIEDKDGIAFFADEPRRREVLAPETAAIMTYILEGVVERGTATSIQALDRPAAGKTGTTNEQRDAWFLGYTPTLAVGVWVGFDDPTQTMGKMGTGGKVAAPIWLDFMKPALAGAPVRDFEIPEGINCVNIDPYSGRRAGEWTPKPFLECFKAGTEPAVAEPVVADPNDGYAPNYGAAEDLSGVDPEAPPDAPPGGMPVPPVPGSPFDPRALPPPTAPTPGGPGMGAADPRWPSGRDVEERMPDRWNAPPPRYRAETVPTPNGPQVRLFPETGAPPPAATPPPTAGQPPRDDERLWPSSSPPPTVQHPAR